MDKFTRKTSFEQWFSPVSSTQMEEMVKIHQFFDRGYLDYERFNRMTDEGFFFVSRLRKNAVTRVIEPFELPENSSVLSDEMILIGTTQNRAENTFRLIKVLEYWIQTGTSCI